MTTDPENRTYTYSAGIRKFASVEEDEKEVELKETNSVLERVNRKKERSKELERIVRLQNRSDCVNDNDFAVNSALRSLHRKERDSLKRRRDEGRSLGVCVPLVPLQSSERKEDARAFFLAKSHSSTHRSRPHREYLAKMLSFGVKKKVKKNENCIVSKKKVKRLVSNSYDSD